MDWKGIAYSAVLLVLISPFVWYLWRQIDRICAALMIPKTPDGKVDVDALLAQRGYQINPVLKEHWQRIETEGADYFRGLFRTGPVGVWHAHNQESLLMGMSWTFRPDHTGEVIRTEVFGYPRERTLFHWREAGDFIIEALVTAREACVSCEPEGPPVWGPDPECEDDEEVTEEAWERIAYAFRVVDEPVRTVVMQCAGHEDFFALGCWPMAPLEWNLPLDPNSK